MVISTPVHQSVHQTVCQLELNSALHYLAMLLLMLYQKPHTIVYQSKKNLPPVTQTHLPHQSFGECVEAPLSCAEMTEMRWETAEELLRQFDTSSQSTHFWFESQSKAVVPAEGLCNCTEHCEEAGEKDTAMTEMWKKIISKTINSEHSDNYTKRIVVFALQHI